MATLAYVQARGVLIAALITAYIAFITTSRKLAILTAS